ncbi:hypothetical protein HMI54_012296, partial [Coelomomyces lativittatus]
FELGASTTLTAMGFDGWIDIEDDFVSGQLHPGDGPQSINCQCCLEGAIEDVNYLVPWYGDEDKSIFESPLSDGATVINNTNVEFEKVDKRRNRTVVSDVGVDTITTVAPGL